MKQIQLALAALMFGSLCSAQGIESILGKRYPDYRSARQLVTEPSTSRDPFPLDAVWVREKYHEGSDDFYDRKLVRVYLDKSSALRGLWGTDGYYLHELSRSRLLLEMDGRGPRDFFVIDKQAGGSLIQYSPSRKSDSRFARALRRAGLASKNNVIQASRAKILDFLKTYNFDTSDVYCRYQRPTHEDMKLVWSTQMLMAWQDRNQNNLSQTVLRMDKLRELGELGVGRVMMEQITRSGAGKLKSFALDKVEFGPSKSGLERMAKYAGSNLTKIDEKIKARMKYLAMRIKSETLTKGDGGQPDPGDVVRFHFVLKTADGRVLADSRKQGKPSDSRISGKMPEGIAYALCSMKMGGKSRFHIPAVFAYGTDRDNMVFEVELLRFVRTKGDKPPLKSGLFGYELAPLDMKETSSKLLYQDMREGKGPKSAKGQSLVIKRASWSAGGRELDKVETITLEPGDSSQPAGLYEGLAGMRPGGVRMLCIPRQLGYRYRDRRGMALRMMVSLVRIEP